MRFIKWDIPLLNEFEQTVLWNTYSEWPRLSILRIVNTCSDIQIGFVSFGISFQTVPNKGVIASKCGYSRIHHISYKKSIRYESTLFGFSLGTQYIIKLD